MEENRMELKIEAFGSEYKYIQSTRNEFNPTEDYCNASENVVSLNERLKSIGFFCIGSKDVKYDRSVFVKIMDLSGRFIIVETYLKEEKEISRKQQSIVYDIWGLEDDVKQSIKKINDEPIQSGAYTCR